MVVRQNRGQDEYLCVTLLQFCVSLTVKSAWAVLTYWQVIAFQSEIISSLSVVLRIIIHYKNHLGVI